MIKHLHEEEKYLEYFKCFVDCCFMDEHDKVDFVSEYEIGREFWNESCKSRVYDDKQHKKGKDKHKKGKSSGNLTCATDECSKSSSVARNANLKNNTLLNIKGRIEDRIASRSNILMKISSSYDDTEEIFKGLAENLINLEESYLDE